MTIQQQELIRASCIRLTPVMEECGELFFSRLFEITPYLRPQIPGDVRTMGVTALLTVTTLVRSIEYPAQAVHLLRELAQAGHTAGIGPAHYDILASAFLWTIERMLGGEFTDSVRNAWVALYAESVSLMRNPEPAVAG